MANYVKFRRGTFTEFAALGNKLENDTLYFIQDESKATVDLYLGSKLISSSNGAGGNVDLKLSDLIDISIENPVMNDVLFYNNISQRWENRSIELLLEDYESEIAVSPDTLSIEKFENKIQLKGFGIGYYAIKRDTNNKIITPISYEYIDGFKEGLVPKVTVENEKLILAWYESDIEEIRSTITDLSNEIQTLDQTINNQDDGLIKQIASLNSEILEANIEIQNLSSTKADLDDVYTKEETESAIDSVLETVYTKEEIDTSFNNVYTKEEADLAIGTAITNTDHLKRITVGKPEDIVTGAPDSEKYIYMVPTGFQDEDNKYEEYMVIDGKVEKVGSWEVDLDQYAKKEDLNNYVEIQEGARLITEKEIEQFSRGEENIINLISEDFTVDQNRCLFLNDLAITKITGLQDALNNKYDKNDGRLVSEEDSKKLSIIEVKDNQASIDVSHITGLESWLNEKYDLSNQASTIVGLSVQVNEHSTKITNLENQLMWQPISDKQE